MGLLTFAGRIVLVVLNIVFILLSLSLIICGFLLRFGQETLIPAIKPVLASIEDNVKTVFNDADFNTDALDLGSAVSGIATVLIIGGLALLGLSFVGCFGACCSCTTIMLVYAIILIVLLVAQMCVVIVVFRFPDTIKDNIKPKLRETLDEFQGLNGTTVVSLGWNWMMTEFECCGVSNYNDFDGKTSWWGNGVLHTPLACCKQLPSTTAERDACAGKKGTHAISTIAANSNYDKGCVDAVWQRVMDVNETYLFAGIGLCFAAQIVLIIFAVLVYKDRGIKGGLV